MNEIIDPTDYGCVDTITMTRKELLMLIFKLDREESTKALLRRGESGNEYVIQAVIDTRKDVLFWPEDEDKHRRFTEWELLDKENDSL